MTEKSTSLKLKLQLVFDICTIIFFECIEQNDSLFTTIIVRATTESGENTFL